MPDYCKLEIERRTLPKESVSECIKEIETAIERARSKHAELQGAVKLNFERSPLEISQTERIVQSVAKAYEMVEKKRPNFVGVTYWSDASIFSQKGKVPTCLFGPGDIDFAHSPVEYVPVREVEVSAHIYAEAAISFCGTK